MFSIYSIYSPEWESTTQPTNKTIVVSSLEEMLWSFANYNEDDILKSNQNNINLHLSRLIPPLFLLIFDAKKWNIMVVKLYMKNSNYLSKQIARQL